MNHLERILYLCTVAVFVAGGYFYTSLIIERDKILAAYGDCTIEFANAQQLPFNQTTWDMAWSQCGDINKTAN